MLDTDGEGADQGGVALDLGGELIPIQFGLDHAVDGFQEVVAVLLKMETQEVSTEHALE